MASLAKTYEREKLLGQHFTPEFIVQKILDDVGYNSKSILGKSILDPACGDGRFLIEVVKRIIKYSSKNNLKKNLSFVNGWDIDPYAIQSCIENLNSLNELKGMKIDWNIHYADSIKRSSSYLNLFSSTVSYQFDYIIGNPPYIRIQHLNEEQRNFIQRNYRFCKSGSTDIFIAFFELCFNLLKADGNAGLITPNTFFYTETARELREFFVERKCVKQITNYGIIQLFDNATTYSAITIFDKNEHSKFLYQQANGAREFIERNIKFSELHNQKFWQLSAEKKLKTNGTRLKDICKIHVGVTTLCDKAYIFSVEDIDENHVYGITKLKGKVKIERAILKPIVKGSTLKNGCEEIKQYIIFPYVKVNGKHQIISEQELKSKFPYTHEYLLSVKNELDKRDNGKPNSATWYAFGRTQSLDNSFGKKIIFSPMNHKPNFVFYENEECTFYSGYCIKYDGNNFKLLKQLNSKRMQKYISISSRDFRGGWKAYNKKAIEDFPIDVDKLKIFTLKN
jgi:type I restriction-modification system DNA methylase subunit